MNKEGPIELIEIDEDFTLDVRVARAKFYDVFKEEYKLSAMSVKESVEMSVEKRGNIY